MKKSQKERGLKKARWSTAWVRSEGGSLTIVYDPEEGKFKWYIGRVKDAPVGTCETTPAAIAGMERWLSQLVSREDIREEGIAFIHQYVTPSVPIAAAAAIA